MKDVREIPMLFFDEMRESHETHTFDTIQTSEVENNIWVKLSQDPRRNQTLLRVIVNLDQYSAQDIAASTDDTRPSLPTVGIVSAGVFSRWITHFSGPGEPKGTQYERMVRAYTPAIKVQLSNSPEDELILRGANITQDMINYCFRLIQSGEYNTATFWSTDKQGE